jgi:hypothetical protein
MERRWNRGLSDVTEVRQPTRRPSASRGAVANADPELIARVVREVLARLRRTSISKSASGGHVLRERVITAAAVSGLPGSVDQLHVPADAVITPAARDELRSRGAKVVRSGSETNDTIGAGRELAEISSPSAASSPAAPVSSASRDEGRAGGVTDSQDPGRAESVTTQLIRRGFSAEAARVVLTDTPAIDLHRWNAAGHRAAMVRDLRDVGRFAGELDPTVWILDMAEMNLIAAVNATCRILRLERHAR